MNTLTLTQQRTVVKYNRSNKRWLAINGQVYQFPAGKDGKRAALLTALAHDHPALAAIVGDISTMHDHNPALVDRLLNAAQLITKGHVFKDGKVKSQTGSEVYQTSCEGEPCEWHCTCQDFDYGLQRLAGLCQYGGIDTDYGLMCKHTLSQLLATFAGIELLDEEIPF